MNLSKTPTFNAVDDDTREAVLRDIEILDSRYTDPDAYNQAALNIIKHHSTSGNYMWDYFYFRALTEKVAERVEELREEKGS